MTDSAIASKIIHALADYLKRDPATITEAHHLRDDLGLDSMAVIELLFEIEERFKIQIPDQDLPALSTVGSVAAYVQERLVPGKTAPAQGAKKPQPAKAAKPVAAKKPTKAAAAKPAKREVKPAKKTAKTAKPSAARTAKKPVSAAKKKKR
jgi:acyl carrier protein